MKITGETVNDITILTLTGELDSRGNHLLDKELRTLSRQACFKVILDISAIRFMGSQTISILISNLKEMRAGSGNIKVLNPQRAVLQYLKINRIIELFEFYSSRAEAIQSFGNLRSTHKKSTNPKTPVIHTIPESESSPSSDPNVLTSTDKPRFETGEILYANSCMLATLIKLLENKGVLSAEEARELMDYESLSLKGVAE